MEDRRDARRGERVAHALRERREAGPDRRCRLRIDRSDRCTGRCVREREARGECLQARVDTHAGAAHGVLEVGPGERQAARTGERAEQRCTDHAARVFRGACEVGKHRTLRGFATGRDECVGVDAAVAHRHLLGHRIDTVRRRDERRAIGRDEPTLQRASGFHQFGGDDDVDLAGEGHQREHRDATVGHGREDLDVIDRRAGALRDARHGRRLRGPAGVFREIDDPVGEHAAAFAAHGKDGDVDGAGRGCGCGVHADTRSGRGPARTMRTVVDMDAADVVAT